MPSKSKTCRIRDEGQPCPIQARARGLCRAHYEQWKRAYGHLTCAEPGCKSHQHDGYQGRSLCPPEGYRAPGRRGVHPKTDTKAWYCRGHERFWLTYSADAHHSNLEALTEQIRPGEDGCWIYTGALSNEGYGMFNPLGLDARATGTQERSLHWWAHRALYALLVGGHRPGLDLDHRTCGKRACVAPHHLIPAAPRANRGRGIPATGRPDLRTAALPAVQRFAQDHGLPLPVLRP